jgi:hypothetical protein
MKKIHLLTYLLLAGICTFSCTGMKNMSGTLTKSDASGSSYEGRHGDYLNNASRKDTVQGGNTQTRPGSPSGEYRKDYAKITDGPTDQTAAVKANQTDQYQQLTHQFDDMDKLADVVLYEVDITERRYNKLLTDFKSASAENRQAISRELDALSANQMTLYKSYVSIYKQGRADWPKVKADVDATLLRLRGITTK